MLVFRHKQRDEDIHVEKTRPRLTLFRCAVGEAVHVFSQ